MLVLLITSKYLTAMCDTSMGRNHITGCCIAMQKMFVKQGVSLDYTVSL